MNANSRSAAEGRRRRLTMGVLLYWPEAKYETNILAGIADVARERDINLLCFAGERWFGSRRTDILPRLASPQNIDGLIVFAGALSCCNFYAGIVDFLNRACEVPVVSLADELPGVPAVMVDNRQGMREVLTHLICAHGYRRLAYIGGPPHNQEAAVRYQTYREVLAEHGLPFVPELVVTGDFRQSGGEEAVALLLDRKGVSFEALVAGNDEMALGALRALQARHVRVPEQLAVVGFDDVDEAEFASPPLTTVRQPLYAQGRLAAEMLLMRLRGELPPPRVQLSTGLVERRSCGCFAMASSPKMASSASAGTEYHGESVPDQRDQLIAELVWTTGEAGRQIDPVWVGYLLDAFTAELQGELSGFFLSILEELLNQTAAANGEVNIWQDVITSLRRQMLPSLVHQPQIRALAESLWLQARLLISDAARRQQGRARLRTDQWVWRWNSLNRELTATVDLDTLLDVLAQGLPRLGIPSCCLTLYDKAGGPAAQGRVVLAYDMHDRRVLRPGGQPAAIDCLVPPELLGAERYTYVVEPLYDNAQDYLGFVLFAMDLSSGAVYEILREQISNTLRVALLLQQLLAREQELARRATELERSNADLARLAYVAAHDLQEPLRLVVSYTQMLARRYRGKLDTDADEFIGYAVEGATRMQRLLADLQAYVRLGAEEERPALQPSALALAAACTSLHTLIEDAGAKIVAGDLPLVNVDVRHMALVFHHLLDNALKFRSPERRPRIEVMAEQRGGEWLFAVRDNGLGFEPQYADKLFVLFQRLRADDKYPGTGIGLAVCRKVIERHGGRIWAESQLGQGSVFYFTLPAAGA